MILEIDSTIESVINIISNPVILTRGGYLQSANKAFLKFFGVSSIKEFNTRHTCIDTLFIKHNGFFAHADIDSDELWTDYLFNRPDRKRIVSLANRSGEVRDFDITLKKIENQSEYIIVFSDITDLISEKNEYQYFAYHDQLTKIYNRQKFDESLVKEIENHKRYGERFSVILIDVDHFKIVNDTYGHIVGDLVLIALAKLIQEKLRINDVFARWGGEEFMIMLPRTTGESAYKKALELRDTIESYVDKELPKFTISSGVTEFYANDTANTLLRRVDEALYKAKEKRNDVVLVNQK